MYERSYATIDVISPITEEVFERVPDPTPADVDRAVIAARRARMAELLELQLSNAALPSSGV